MELSNVDIGIYLTDPNHYILDNSRKSLSGSYGEVNFLKDIGSNKKCVVKINKDTLSDDRSRLLFNREVRILAVYLHPAIVPFLGYSIKDNHGCIYLEEIENGSLAELIKRKQSLSMTQKYIISYGVALAMQYLHRYDCIHRDLKTENILLDKYFYPYITDFGTSKEVSQEELISSSKFATTPKITAPELLEDEIDDEDMDPKNSFPIDVYAYGITLFELWAGKQIYQNYKRTYPLFIDINKGYREEIPPGVKDNWKELIKICWSPDPKKRPTFDKIIEYLQSPKYFTKDIDKKEVKKYEEFLKDKDKQLLQMKNISKQLVPTYIFSEDLKKLKKLASSQISTLDDIYNYIVVQSTSKYGKTDHYQVYLFSKKYFKIINDDKTGKYKTPEWTKKTAMVEMCVGKSLCSVGCYKYSENYLRRSYNHGKAMSAYYLAEMMSCKLVKERQTNEMNHLYEYSASKGIYEAQKKLPFIQFNKFSFNNKENKKVLNYALAIRCKYGIDTEIDLNKFMELMLESANENYGPAMVEIGLECFRRKKEKEADIYFKKAAKAEYPEGNFYHAVSLIKKNQANFMNDLEKAVNGQIPDAIGLYGSHLDSQKKRDVALTYLRRAAELGSFGALICLAEICEENIKSGDPEFYYKKAAYCCHCLDTEGFKSPVEYQVYECKTCKKRICQACANFCHKGHKVVPIDNEICTKCDCGSKGIKAIKSLHDNYCNEKINLYGNACQHFFVCLTCCSNSNKCFICQNCIKNCHNGHNVRDCGIQRGFCSCGKHFLPNGFKCKNVQVVIDSS